MIQIDSQLEGRRYRLHKLELILKPQGYAIGGNWDYDQGFFDYKMADDEGYQFLRIPFTAIEGELDKPGTIVELGKPFVLSHVYEEGINEQARSGNLSASINQFSEPVDPDGKIEQEYEKRGRVMVERLEQLLMQ